MVEDRLESFQDWAWATPPAMERATAEGYHTFKGIPYALVRSLNYTTASDNNQSCWAETMGGVYDTLFPCQDIRDQFQETFRSLWRNDKSLLIASEGFYNVAFMSPERSAALVQNLIDLLPWNVSGEKRQGLSLSDITVVVHHRAPRYTHLVSLWHQCCMHTMTFAQYIASDRVVNGMAEADSLLMVERFLDHGFHVVLIDLLGVSRQPGLDVTTVMACRVLQVPCEENNTTIRGLTDPPSRHNIRAGLGDMGNVTEEQLQSIDEILRRRDCTFAHLQNHSRLEILQGDVGAVLANWATCTPAERNDRAFDRKAMAEELLKVLHKNKAIPTK